MFYVYILQSEKDKKLYTGHTQNLTNRLKLHNAGLVLSTRFRKPLRLVYFEQFETRDNARWREYQLKHHSDKMSKVKQFFKGWVAPPQRGSAPAGTETARSNN